MSAKPNKTKEKQEEYASYEEEDNSPEWTEFDDIDCIVNDCSEKQLKGSKVW